MLLYYFNKILVFQYQVKNMFFRARFPPYSDRNLALLRHMVERRRNYPIMKYLSYMLVFGLGMLATVGFKAAMKVQKRY